jgi:hypothetical protein
VAIGSGSVVIGDAHTPAAFSRVFLSQERPTQAMARMRGADQQPIVASPSKPSAMKASFMDTQVPTTGNRFTKASERINPFDGPKPMLKAGFASSASTPEE